MTSNKPNKHINTLMEMKNMFFKSYTFTWWQIGIFKLALLSIGVAIGAYWSVFFKNYLAPLIIIAIITSAYIMFVSFKQLK